MDAYTDFASVYDTFMDETPYEQWAIYLKDLLAEYQCEKGLILELGCGTGTMTQLLAQSGYDMIGLDNSVEMLNLAKQKMENNNSDILYLMQDMREFELYGTVKAVFSVCDSINYIVDQEDLLKVFRLVNNYLDPSGIFIFDINTNYKYRDVIGDTVIAENRENCSFIWENSYEEETNINEYDLTIFVEEENGLYHKFSETHYQRGYELTTMKMLIEKSGLRFVTAYDAFTRNAPHQQSERIYIVAQELGKV